MSEEELKQNIFMNENENGYDYVKRINTQYTKNGLYQNVGRTINILKQQLKDKDEKISKAIGHINACCNDKGMCEDEIRYLKEILESNKED